MMIGLIKKGGLRERANRSRRYQGSENTETTLTPNRYQHVDKLKINQSTEDMNITQIPSTHPTTTTPQK